MLLVDRVVGWVAPHACIGCGRVGAVLCSECLLSAGDPPAPRCAGCKILSDGYKTCRSCRSWLDIYAVFVATEYGGLYELLVKAYKFQFQRQAAEPIARIMLGISGVSFPVNSLIIPLPTAPARIRSRGFDHTKLLVQQWYKFLTPAVRKQLQLSCELKRRSNSRQAGSSREQRIKQVASEFYVSSPKAIRGKSCILFDDITTTGASLAAAAEALKSAGATRVYAIVFAQKI